MAKKKKKSNAKPIAVAVAALAVVGAFMPSDEVDTEDIRLNSSVSASLHQELENKKETEIIIDEDIEYQDPVNVQNTEENETKVNEPAEHGPVIEIDPERAFRDKLAQYNYVASSESDKYHYPSCRWTDKINDTNLVHFDTKEEAVAAGYQACGTCG